MSWVRIGIHLVFTTKNRKPLLRNEIRGEIFNHIKENAALKGIWIDCINGSSEHAHCLIFMNKDQSISQVVQLVKGESSFWINKNKIIKNKFSWQDDYWAASVSESHVESIREYIRNQEEHHRKKSFAEEVDEFMKKYGGKFAE